ncbi:MAG TPA: 30S ribosomal protein S8, partial [Candidatus Limnocylindria bacterium]|nr:30S ribosomal protein S8 [Candidatus Limnocylindria bacterium]
MNTSDPIADMLTRIRNASLARHRELTLPSSKMKREIARILVDEGFIESFSTEPGGVQETLNIQLKYVEGRTPVVSGLKRISKPGLRVYARKTEIPRV